MFQFLSTLFGGKAREVHRPARPQPRPRARLGVEELTSRILPNATTFSLATGQLFDHHADASSSSGSLAGHLESGSQAGDHCGVQATLAATLTNASGATGQASYSATTGSLKIQVHGAAASTALNVIVDGTTVGTLTTNASGNGQVKLAHVTVNAGSTIIVGDLTGTFAQVAFSASLTGSTGVSGSAAFNSVKNRLHLSVSGAAANTTYNVTINNVVVGQLTTNSSGTGKLHLSPSGVTILSGSTITVSDTLGNPAILTGAFA